MTINIKIENVFFSSSNNFWYCNHCEKNTTRIIITKFTFVICESSTNFVIYVNREDLTSISIIAFFMILKKHSRHKFTNVYFEFDSIEYSFLIFSNYNIFIECSRLWLWTNRECVDVFDRTYANYSFFDVVSDEENLNEFYVAKKNVFEIVNCLNLSIDFFSRLFSSREKCYYNIKIFIFFAKYFDQIFKIFLR